MGKIKKAIKAITPPILVAGYRRLTRNRTTDEWWSGNYKSWEEATSYCSGYDDITILNKCRDSLLKVKRGEAVYERDSVLFDQIHFSWGLLAGLQKAAMSRGNSLCVLDFGGSLGSTYFQNREFLKSLNEINWCIIEQKHFVECGRKDFEDGQLKFFFSVEECVNTYKPNVLLLSSVLPYLAEPYEWLGKLLRLEIEYVILDRTAFIHGGRDIITIQKVPDYIYKASYPAWFLNKEKVFDAFKGYHYIKIGEWTANYRINIGSHGGALFQLKRSR